MMELGSEEIGGGAEETNSVASAECSAVSKGIFSLPHDDGGVGGRINSFSEQEVQDVLPKFILVGACRGGPAESEGLIDSNTPPVSPATLAISSAEEYTNREIETNAEWNSSLMKMRLLQHETREKDMPTPTEKKMMWDSLNSISQKLESLRTTVNNCTEILAENLPEPCTPTPKITPWISNWDGLDPVPVLFAPETPEDNCNDYDSTTNQEVYTARRNIILVRHGQYNQDDDEDDTNQTLTALGKEQATYAGKHLDTLGEHFTSITSSEMIRAKQTACIMLSNMSTQSHLKLVNDSLSNEGAPCIPEPPPPSSTWNPTEREFLEDGARIEAAYKKYFHRAEATQKEDSWEILVCHANVIRYFTCRALQFPPEGWIRIAVDHGSITHFVISQNGEVVLRGLGDSGYIPIEKRS